MTLVVKTTQASITKSLGNRFRLIIIPRALRHRDVAAQTRDRMEIFLIAVPHLQRTTACCVSCGMTQ